MTHRQESLAGGLPLSAVTRPAEIMDAPAPGGLGGTYAGNPLAIAAAHAVIDVIAEEQLPERGQRARRAAARPGWQALRARACPQIADVRGLGAMVAVEFSDARHRRARCRTSPSGCRPRRWSAA